MKLCKGPRCRWYHDPSKYGRKCYYEPQCILGITDSFIDLFRLAVALHRNPKLRRPQ